jgi:hypothetical protein
VAAVAARLAAGGRGRVVGSGEWGPPIPSGGWWGVGAVRGGGKWEARQGPNQRLKTKEQRAKRPREHTRGRAPSSQQVLASSWSALH